MAKFMQIKSENPKMKQYEITEQLSTWRVLYNVIEVI